jgi:hypothetical protein
MFASLLALMTVCVPPPPSAPAAAAPRADSLATLYRGGLTWEDFLAGARARRALWVDNYERGSVDAGLLARARAVGGTWRWLVVAVDGCSDSASTIPYLARLVEQVPGSELRIVAPSEARWVMEQHRADDGRAATPTVLLLDAAYAERGCFVERPRALRRWLAAAAGRSDQERYEGKMAWYRDDAGAETLRDLVEIMEGAAAGRPVCERGAAPAGF